MQIFSNFRTSYLNWSVFQIPDHMHHSFDVTVKINIIFERIYFKMCKKSQIYTVVRFCISCVLSRKGFQINCNHGKTRAPKIEK